MEEQPEQAAVDGGAGMGPNSFSRAKPRPIRKPSMPAGALSCRAKGAPVLSNPMGNTKAADSKHNVSVECMTSLFASLPFGPLSTNVETVNGIWTPYDK